MQRCKNAQSSSIGTFCPSTRTSRSVRRGSIDSMRSGRQQCCSSTMEARSGCGSKGYLANEDFLAALGSGLGRIAVVHKNCPDAERWYNDVVARFGDSHWAAEVMHWHAVARYKGTNDHTVPAKCRGTSTRTPDHLWTAKAVPWP